MWGLWGWMNGVVASGDVGCSKRDRNLWNVGEGTVDDGRVAICQLAAGIAWKENLGGECFVERYVVGKLAHVPVRDCWGSEGFTPKFAWNWVRTLSILSSSGLVWGVWPMDLS